MPTLGLGLRRGRGPLPGRRKTTAPPAGAAASAAGQLGWTPEASVQRARLLHGRAQAVVERLSLDVRPEDEQLLDQVTREVRAGPRHVRVVEPGGGGGGGGGGGEAGAELHSNLERVQAVLRATRTRAQSLATVSSPAGRDPSPPPTVDDEDDEVAVGRGSQANFARSPSSPFSASHRGGGTPAPGSPTASSSPSSPASPARRLRGAGPGAAEELLALRHEAVVLRDQLRTAQQHVADLEKALFASRAVAARLKATVADLQAAGEVLRRQAAEAGRLCHVVQQLQAQKEWMFGRLQAEVSGLPVAGAYPRLVSHSDTQWRTKVEALQLQLRRRTATCARLEAQAMRDHDANAAVPRVHSHLLGEHEAEKVGQALGAAHIGRGTALHEVARIIAATFLQLSDQLLSTVCGNLRAAVAAHPLGEDPQHDLQSVVAEQEDVARSLEHLVLVGSLKQFKLQWRSIERALHGRPGHPPRRPSADPREVPTLRLPGSPSPRPNLNLSFSSPHSSRLSSPWAVR